MPEARATVSSLFAAALLATSGLDTAVAPLASEAHFELLFATAALMAVVPLGRIAALACRRYTGA